MDFRDYKNDPHAFWDSVIDLFYDGYFNGKEGHDYTDEQVELSVNKEDVDKCVAEIKTILYKHFDIKEN